MSEANQTATFFSEYMPNKLKEKPDLVQSVKAIIQFDITGDGGGVWHLDLLNPPGAVKSGPSTASGCVITVDKATWEKILESPSYAMQAFMLGKVKATNIALAMQLQKILA
jgi:putative sterol carrier protein